MNNISVKTLIIIGLATTSMFAIIDPAFAGNDGYKGFYDALKGAYPTPPYQPPAPTPYRAPVYAPRTPYQPQGGNSSPSYTPSGSSSPSSGSYDDGSGLEGLGAIFSLFNFGPGAISSNGSIQYGVQSKFGFENIRVRTGMHFGSGTTINGAFTYNLSGQPTMFNPFIGGGLGFKSIQEAGKIDSDAFSFYGTGGVDLNLTNNLSISGAVNLPTNSTYGTEFQAGINFFGSF